MGTVPSNLASGRANIPRRSRIAPCRGAELNQPIRGDTITGEEKENMDPIEHKVCSRPRGMTVFESALNSELGVEEVEEVGETPVHPDSIKLLYSLSNGTYLPEKGELPFSIEISNRLPMPMRVIVGVWNAKTKVHGRSEWIVLPRETAPTEESRVRKERCRFMPCLPDDDGHSNNESASCNSVEEGRRLKFHHETKVTRVTMVFGWHRLDLCKEDLVLLPELGSWMPDKPPLTDEREQANDFYFRVRLSTVPEHIAHDKQQQVPLEAVMYRGNLKVATFWSKSHKNEDIEDLI